MGVEYVDLFLYDEDKIRYFTKTQVELQFTVTSQPVRYQFNLDR